MPFEAMRALPWFVLMSFINSGSSSVPALAADGSCPVFQPVPVVTMATADASADEPYVIRNWDAACTRQQRPESTDAALLAILGANTEVQPLSAPYDHAEQSCPAQLGNALAAQAAGKPLYYQVPMHLRSAGAAETLCTALPMHLDNGSWLDCLGARFVDELSTGVFSWLAVFVGTNGTGMSLHRDELVARVWAVQHAGRKRFVFCPPSEEDSVAVQLEEHEEMVNAFNASSWAVIATKFQPAACYHTLVMPGDLVMWPSTWFHQSMNVGRSVGVSSFALTQQLFDEFLAAALSMQGEANGALLQKMVDCKSHLPP